MYVICLRTGGETNCYKKLASFHTPGTEMLPNSLKYTSLKLKSIIPSSSNSHNQPIAHKEWTSRKRKKQHDQVLRFWIVRNYILYYNVRIIYSNSFWNMRNWMNLSGQELSYLCYRFWHMLFTSLHKYVSNWKRCWSATIWKHLATRVIPIRILFQIQFTWHLT